MNFKVKKKLWENFPNEVQESEARLLVQTDKRHRTSFCNYFVIKQLKTTIILCLLSQMLQAIPVEYLTDLRKPTDLWNININNDQIAIAYLKGIITSRQSGILYKARTTHFQLPAGTQQIRHQFFKNIQILQTTLENFNTTLEPGNYTFHTQVVNYYSNEILGEVSLEIQLEDFDKNTTQTKIAKHKNTNLQIQATIDSRYTHDFNTNYHANEYTRLILNPSLTFYDIPLTAHTFITTENNETGTNINQFNLKFDTHKFQQLLLQKCLDHFSENENAAARKKMLEDLKVRTAQSKMENYESWKKQLENPDLQNTLVALEELEALENILQDKVLKKKYVALEGLEKQMGNGNLETLKKPLKNLEANRVEFNHLQEIYKHPKILDFIKKHGSETADEIHNLEKQTFEKQDLLILKKRDFKQIQNLLNVGLDHPEELKQLQSFDNFWQNIHFKKEYEAIKNKHKILTTKKKKYKKALQAKKQLDEIEKANIEELLSNPETLKKFASQQGLLNQAANILSNFETIEVGNLYPIYNQLMLNGVSCRGANIAWNPGNFYLNIFSGKTIGQTFLDSILQNNNKQIYAVKIGLGNTNKNHIHFNYLLGKGATLEKEDKSIHNANQVIGTDFSYLFVKKIKLSGELNHSIYHPDKNASGEIKKELAQKSWAGFVELLYLGKHGNTYFKATKINPQYQTFGLPFLMNDQFSMEAGLEKTFLENQLSANCFIRKESGKGNLSQKTTAKSINGNLIYSPTGKPFVNLFYNLLHLDTQDFDSNTQKNINHNISITSGHNYKLKNTLLYSQLTYAYQRLDNESFLSFSDSIITTNFTNYYQQQAHTMSFSQQFNCKNIKINTTGSWNKYNTKNTDDLYTIETNIGFPIFKQKLKTILGILYAGQGSAWKRGTYTQFIFGISKYLNFNFNLRYEQLSANMQDKKNRLQGLNFNGRLNFKF